MSLKILNYNKYDKLSLYYKVNIIYNDISYDSCIDFINDIEYNTINESDINYIYINFDIDNDVDTKIYLSLILKYTQNIDLRKDIINTQNYILYGDYDTYLMNIRNNILNNDNMILYDISYFKNKHIISLTTNKKILLPNINTMKVIKTYNFILEKIETKKLPKNINIFNIKYNNFNYNHYIMMKYNNIMILLYLHNDNLSNNIYVVSSCSKVNNKKYYIYNDIGTDPDDNNNNIYFVYDPIKNDTQDVLNIVYNIMY